MMPVRPKSIVQFDWIYLAVIVLSLVQLVLQWDRVALDPSVRVVTGRLGMASLYAFAFALVLVQLLLWYFVARRGSVIAKWLLIALTVYTLYDTVSGFVSRGISGGPGTALDLVLSLLQVIAITLLFRPDTATWFGEPVSPA